MSKNKNARLDTAMPKREAESITYQSNDSMKDSITESEKHKGKIESLLLEGEQNALKARELKSALGLATEREFRLAVQHERDNGALILSSAAGYFLPERASDGTLTEKAYTELKQSYHLLRAMGIGTLKSAKPLRLAVKEYEERHHVGE